MNQYKTLCEMDINNLLGQVLQKPILQPDSNIGEFGQLGPTKTEITIIQEEDGLRIKSPGLCVKLDTAVVKALSRFLEENKLWEC